MDIRYSQRTVEELKRAAARERLFDAKSVVLGVGLFAAMLVSAAVWRMAAGDTTLASLKEFVFTPEDPAAEKIEFKEPQRELMRELIQDRTDLQEQKPDIQQTTEIKDVEVPEDVVKTRNLDFSPEVDIRAVKLDLAENMEKADDVADQTADALSPIAVLTSGPADLYRTSEPKPRIRPRAALVSTAPRPSMQLKVSPRQFGDLEKVAVGELGPVDINLFGSGDYLSSMGRAGFETRTAVDSALRWLALHQEPEGWWSVHRWDEEDAPVSAPATGEVKERSVTERVRGVTGLSVIALLGGGHSLRKGEHRLAVMRAIEWLMARQDAKTGYLSPNMYEHAIGTIALCEAFGRSPDERVGLAARRAVDACIAGVAKDGGWRYQPNAPESDVSVASWFLQALKTAKLANIKFDHTVFSKGLTYIDQVTDHAALADSSGAVGYQYDVSLIYPHSHPALTCAAMMIRQFNGMGVRHPLLLGGAELTKRQPPDWDRNKDFYYWYYASYAMHNMGGEYRLWWNRRIRDVLLDHQSRRGHQAGSWNPESAKWDGGRVYCTALGALCLEVYYRYGEALQSFATVPDIAELYFK